MNLEIEVELKTVSKLLPLNGGNNFI